MGHQNLAISDSLKDMKVLGPFAYRSVNQGVLLLLKDCFYIVTLNTKTSLKYIIYNEVPFLYSDPVDGLTIATLDQFLDKHQYLKFDYDSRVKVMFNHSWGNNSIEVNVDGNSHKFLIIKRSQSKFIQDYLHQAFKDNLTVNGTYIS